MPWPSSPTAPPSWALGNLGPLGALPVMEGKSMIFKEFAGVNAYPLCLDTHSTAELIQATLALAPGFGGINLEDIAAPGCFEVERTLQAALDIPVFHDDQHGTAIVVSAALINACRLTGRTFTDVRVVQVGMGAAGTAIANALLDAGITDLVAFDRDGVLGAGADVPVHHAEVAARSNPRGVTDLEQALIGADVFIGTARRGSVHPDWLRTMAPRAVVFALSNPEPEVYVEEVRDDVDPRHRPQRHAQPAQQLAVLPGVLPRRPRRPGHPGHAWR